MRDVKSGRADWVREWNLKPDPLGRVKDLFPLPVLLDEPICTCDMAIHRIVNGDVPPPPVRHA